MTNAIQVRGDEQLRTTASHAARELADMEATNRAAGELIRARAASVAPKVSGNLAGSIRAEMTATQVVVATDVVYGPPINYGWPAHNITAQPFMDTALTDTERAVIDKYAARVNDVTNDIRGA